MIQKVLGCKLQLYIVKNNQLQSVSLLLTQVYEILVMETKPAQAISIIECDMQVGLLVWK